MPTFVTNRIPVQLNELMKLILYATSDVLRAIALCLCLCLCIRDMAGQIVSIVISRLSSAQRVHRAIPASMFK